MPYDPKEPVWCEVCKKNILKAGISKHRKQKGHISKASGTHSKSEFFYCSACGRDYPKGHKSDHFKTKVHISNLSFGSHVEREKAERRVRDEKIEEMLSKVRERVKKDFDEMPQRVEKWRAKREEMAKRRGKRMDKLEKIDRKEEKEFNRRNSIECSSDSDSESISSVE